MTEQQLGYLEQVDLRQVWESEDRGFTPWLAQPDNLNVLGETLGMGLAVEAIEKTVGSFRADLVCNDSSSKATVLIENQLNASDHSHLGQLLTYGAGLEAVTVIWLARNFREEHRAAVDWLNRITHEEFRFFALEIQLWRIGDSAIAPKFSVVSMPNDWSRSASSAMEGNRHSTLNLKRREYWSGLLAELDEQNGPVSGNLRPQPQNYMIYSIGRGGFSLRTTLNKDNQVRVELYISGEAAKERLAALDEDRAGIQQELGYELVWGDQEESARDRRVSYYLAESDPENESDWARQHRLLAEHLNKFYRVFSERVKQL